jgi:hypothetical protein
VVCALLFDGCRNGPLKGFKTTLPLYPGIVKGS